MKALLYPLSVVYRFVTSLRNYLYDHQFISAYKSSCKVISVGNLTAGGNGKTPACIFLARKLEELGHKPVVLSRGYGGRIAGPYFLSGQENYLEVGDEPLLMARAYGLKVVIAKNRVSGAKFIERKDLGDIIILDDGFQHRRLRRNLDLLCVNWGTEESVKDFEAGQLLPLGRFREAKGPGLARATAIMWIDRRVNGSNCPPPPVIDKPSFLARFRVASLVNRNGIGLSPGADVFGFCSIANPEGFRESLSSLGYRIKGFVALADHASISLAKVRAQLGGAALACTEKDLVKLAESEANDIYVLKIDFEVEHESAFVELLKQRLAGDEG